jgi:hypothetical protein
LIDGTQAALERRLFHIRLAARAVVEVVDAASFDPPSDEPFDALEFPVLSR